MDKAAHLTLRDIFLLVRQKKIDVETLFGILREVFEGMTNVEEAEHEIRKSVRGKGKTA
mgnify:CR=1 FL=1